MKLFYLLLLFFILSCADDSKPEIIKISNPPAGFICKYEEAKSVCRSVMKKPADAVRKKQITRLICDSLIPCWYGTQWDFNGTTEAPGEGKIACGYFVTTIIRDAGIPVLRIKMAQCASEEMIETLCEKPSVKRYSNLSITDFVNNIKKMGTGLYITGLDNHTGFIYHDGSEVYFIHASYASPKCVLKELAASSSILQQSKYKVIGKLKI